MSTIEPDMDFNEEYNAALGLHGVHWGEQYRGLLAHVAEEIAAHAKQKPESWGDLLPEFAPLPEPVTVHRDESGGVCYEEDSEAFSYARGVLYMTNNTQGKYADCHKFYDTYLPGHLLSPKEACGHYFERGHTHGTVRFSKYQRIWCYQRDCKRCFAAAIRRFADRAGDVLWGYKQACHSDVFLHKESGPLHHYVVSCSKEDMVLVQTRAGRTKVRRKYVTMLRNLGRWCVRCEKDSVECKCHKLSYADGKCKKCERDSAKCRCVDSSFHSGGLHGSAMIFHGCRFNDRAECPYWGPHFHVICMGYVDVHGWRVAHKDEIKAGLMCSTPTAENEKRTGVVVRRIRRKNPNLGESKYMDIETRGELASLLYYLGTHITRALGEHSIFYYGTAANNRHGITKAQCHKSGVLDEVKKWFDKDIRNIKHRGDWYELKHARVQRVTVAKSDRMSRRDWRFDQVEVLGRGKEGVADDLFEYLEGQVRGHAYATEDAKVAHRRPYEGYFAVAKTPLVAQLPYGSANVVTYPADPKSSVNRPRPRHVDRPRPRHVNMELTYARRDGTHHTSQEFHHVRYHHLWIDPSLDGLCPACFEPFEVLLPRSGVYPTPPGPKSPSLRLYRDGVNWTTLSDGHDYLRGTPFVRKGRTVQEWDCGLLDVHPYEKHLDRADQVNALTLRAKSYANLYAKIDNSTFVDLYRRYYVKYDKEPDAVKMRELQKEARKQSIVNVMGYMQVCGLPTEERALRLKCLKEGEYVDPIEWIYDFVCAVWRWLYPKSGQKRISRYIEGYDSNAGKPKVKKRFVLASSYFRGEVEPIKSPAIWDLPDPCDSPDPLDEPDPLDIEDQSDDFDFDD